MTPLQKRAMEYYTPRVKTGGKTTGYTRDDVQLRAEQLQNNATQRYERKQLEAESRLQMYMDAMAKGQLQQQAELTTQLTRQANAAKAVVRNQVLQSDVGGGDYQRHIEASTMLEREHALATAQARAAATEQDIGSGAYAQHEAALRPVQRRQQNMQAQAQAQAENADMKHALSTGELQKQSKAMVGLSRERERMAAAARNEAAAEDLASGAYRQHAEAMMRVEGQYREQQEQMVRVRRETELTARYGSTVGGFLAKYEGSLGIAAAGLAGVGFMAHRSAERGFQGTVEQNRSDYAGRRLDREIAGIFMPLKEAGTQLKSWAAVQLSKTSSSQQNMMMYGALGAGALGMTGAAFKGFQAYQWLRGAGGGLASMAGGAASKAAASAAASAAGSAAGSAVGTGVAAAAAGGGIGATLMGAGRWALRSGKWALRKTPYIGSALAVADSGIIGGSEDSYYSYHRKAGRNKFASGGLALLDSVVDPFDSMWKGVFGGKTLEEKRREAVGLSAKKPGEGHRMPVLMNAGFTQGQQYFEDIQEAASKVDNSFARGLPDNSRYSNEGIKRDLNYYSSRKEELAGRFNGRGVGPAQGLSDAEMNSWTDRWMKGMGGADERIAVRLAGGEGEGGGFAGRSVGPEGRAGDRDLAEAARDLRDAARDLRRRDRDDRRLPDRPEG